MKKTEADKVYAEEFGRQLVPHYRRNVLAGNAKQTPSEFADALGVSTGALQKYLEGQSMPSLRTVIRAYDAFRILIPYEGRDLKLLARLPKKRRHSSEAQLTLPLTIESPETDLRCSVVKKTSQPFRLLLSIRRVV